MRVSISYFQIAKTYKGFCSYKMHQSNT